MKLTTNQKLTIYRRTLARYEETNDPMASVQRQLIEALEIKAKAKP
jgi:hypothetical protein